VSVPLTRRLVIDLASPRAAWRIDERSVAAIRSGLGAGWDVVEVRAPAPSDGDGGPGSAESIAAARGAEIYLGYGVPAGVVEAGRTSLRWVHTGTAGVGSSLPQLRGTKIVLTNSAGVHAEPMADWVIAAIAYFARGLDRMVEAQALGRWAKDEFTDLTVPVRELRDLRVGILGLGGIGQAVARRALALGMSVAGVRRRVTRDGPPGGSGGLRWVGVLNELPRLAAESDVLVIAAPHTGATAGAVSRRVLELLPKDGVVVNVSRGSLLDEAALLELIEAGRLRGAALDVFGMEPLPEDHPFWGHPRVLVSPHVSAVSARFWERETALIVDNIRRYLAGAPLANVVDLEAGY
jgi:phosphoglycerate dehydrogenase-like enzyme